MDQITKIKLEEIGFNTFFNSELENLTINNVSVGRVISEYKEAYRVKDSDGEYFARITGKYLFNASKRLDFPAVGDWVLISKTDKDKAIIQNILPRKTILQKRFSNKKDAQIIAVNIDIAFIVQSLDKDYNLNRFERYFVLANEGGITPVIILNKTDLVTDEVLNKIIEEIKKRFVKTDILCTSVVTEEGLEELMRYIEKGKTYCFIGSSGVGKSSIINKLVKKDIIRTQQISDVTGKGKHTTTTRELYVLESGGIVIDNPGTREVGMIDVSEGIENIFDEITLLSQECKYSNCTHRHEPGCAVIAALNEGKLDELKYENYIKLKKENEFYEQTPYEKRQKDKKFGKFFKKAMDQLKDQE